MLSPYLVFSTLLLLRLMKPFPNGFDRQTWRVALATGVILAGLAFVFLNLMFPAQYGDIWLSLWFGVAQWVLVPLALVLSMAGTYKDFENLTAFAAGVALAVPFAAFLGFIIFAVTPSERLNVF